MRSYCTWALGALSFVVLATPAAGQRGLAAAPRFAATAPAPWLQQDPGDSLYQAGRSALNRGDYRGAARAFRTLRSQHARSGYVADSYYWQAFAMSKLGSTDDLHGALALLDEQQQRYPDARTARDARALRLRVQGDLAQMGDAAAAAAVASAAAPAAGVRGGPPGAPTGPRPPAKGVARGIGQGAHGECSDEDDDRLIALNALLQMQAEQAIPILRQVLQRRDEGSVCLRRQAVFLVSQKKSPETAKLLLDAARSDPDAKVRENAVFWLSQAPTADAIPALDSILQNAADSDLQDKAVFALGQIKDEAAGRALRTHLERAGTPEQIKASIIFWMGQQKSEANAQYLKDFYAKTTSAALKEKVLFSIAQMGLEENGRWLLDVAVDPNSPTELRKNALFWAAQSKAVPFADLAALYDRTGDAELKDQLIFAYSQSQDPAALDKLMSIARAEPDKKLRSQAIFWLGQSHDPRAAQFLMEVINK
jgi:HEAT repeat protein